MRRRSGDLGGRCVVQLTPMDLSRLSILVIDDSAHMRTLLRKILNGFGVRRVYEASDGEDGYSSTVEQRPDIVLCDWVMWPGDGADFMTRLRADEDAIVSTTPVIMLSADTRKAVILKALQLGIHEFLAKPISPALMYARMERTIRENRPFLRKGRYFGPVPRSSVPAPSSTGKRKEPPPDDEEAVFI
ncbi:response regulator [Rhizobiales bacterium]|uniref:response regulator n=1 Tax=Hongsoonwoonella zoysiae TaxID=2821844 RepID=UPI00155FFB1F|nr:response regulator [Hongsoonwoonella zoysiae]NRG18612.1 response regulator [Hongsoonwoonella zoysiae]